MNEENKRTENAGFAGEKCCGEGHSHSRMMSELTALMPDDDLLFSMADLFKIFGDSTRMRILFALFEKELCVFAITEMIGMNQSAVSHQLKVLRDSNLVGTHREGKTIYYFLSDDHVRTIIGQGYEHLTEKNAVDN